MERKLSAMRRLLPVLLLALHFGHSDAKTIVFSADKSEVDNTTVFYLDPTESNDHVSTLYDITFSGNGINLRLWGNGRNNGSAGYYGVGNNLEFIFSSENDVINFNQIRLYSKTSASSRDIRIHNTVTDNEIKLGLTDSGDAVLWKAESSDGSKNVHLVNRGNAYVLSKIEIDYDEGSSTPDPRPELHSVTVNIAGSGVTASLSNADGAISGESVEAGTSVTCHLNVEEGYEVSSLKINGTERLSEVTEDSITFIVDSATDISITSRLKQYSVSWTEQSGISAELNGQSMTSGQTIEHGQSISITVVAPQGKIIDRVSVNGIPVDHGENNRSFSFDQSITSNTVIEAVYTDEPVVNYTLHVEESAGTEFKIYLNQDFNNQLVNNSKVPAGQMVSIYAGATTGYTLKTVSVNDVEYVVTNHNSMFHVPDFNVDGDIHVSAHAVKMHTINWVQPDNCTIRVSESGKALDSGALVEDGTEISVSIIPDAGFEIESIQPAEVFGNNYTDGVEDLKISVNTPIDLVVKVKQKTYAVKFEIDNGIELTVNGQPYKDLTDVIHGTKLELIIKAADGYDLTEVNINGNSIDINGLNSITQTVTVTQETIVKVLSTQRAKYSISWNESEHAEINVTCGDRQIASGDEIEAGNKIHVIITPDAGYELVSAVIGGKEYAPANGVISAEFELTEAVTIECTVRAKTYGFTPEIGANANATILIDGAEVNGPVDLTHGKEISITVKANDGYRLVSLTLNGETIDCASKTEVTVSHVVKGAVNITVTTEKMPEYSVNWNETTGAKITVTSEGKNISAGSELRKGSKIAVRIEAAEGYELVSAVIGGKEYEPGNGVISAEFELTEAVTIECTVRAKTYGFTPELGADANAIVLIDGAEVNGPVDLTHGKEVAITVKANDGYRLLSLTLNGETFDCAGKTEVTVSHVVKGAVNITVTTEKMPEYSVNWNETTGAKITVTSEGKNISAGSELRKGSKIAVRIEAAEGYELVSAVIGGKEYEPGNGVISAEFELTEAVTIECTVRAKTYGFTPEIGANANATILIDGAEVNGAIDLTHGKEISITVKANDGYRLVSLTLNGETIDCAGKTEMTVSHVVKGAVNLTATTEKIPEYSVNWNETTGAKITVISEGKNISAGNELRKGSKIAVKIEAAEGYELLSAVIGGKEYAPVNDVISAEFELTEAVTIDCTVRAKTYGFTPELGADANAIVLIDGAEVNGAIDLTHGKEISITVKANDGYRLVSLTLNGETIDCEGKTEVTVSHVVKGAVNLTAATEKIPEYSVNWNETTGAKITVTSEGKNISAGSELRKGSKIAVRIEAAEGYELVSAVIGGKEYAPVNGVISSELELTEAVTIECTVRAKTYGFTPEIGADANATILIDGVEVNGPVDLTHGKEISITVKANDGYRLVSLTLNGETIDCAGKTEVTVSHAVKGAVNISVTTEKIPEYSVNWNETTGAKITVTSEGKNISAGNELRRGSKIAVKIEAAEGYDLVSAVIGGKEYAPVNGVISSELELTEAVTIECTVRAKTYGFTPEIGADTNATVLIDGVEVNGPVDLTHGKEISITVKANDGYRLVSLTLNGETIDCAGKTEVTVSHVVKGAVNITATTEKIPEYSVVWACVGKGSLDIAREQSGDYINSGDAIMSGEWIYICPRVEKGWRVARLLINNKEITISDRTNPAPIKHEVTGPTVISIEFERAVRTITVKADSELNGLVRINGDSDNTSGIEIATGSSVIIEAEPYIGCEFDYWSSSGNRIDGGKKLIYDVTTGTDEMDIELVAHFKAVSYGTARQITLGSEPSDMGQVKVIQLGGDETAMTLWRPMTFTTDKRIVAQASCADENVIFGGWIDNDGNVVSDELLLIHVPVCDVTLTAHFYRMVCIYFSMCDNGRIRITNNNGSEIESGSTVQTGSTVTIELSPDSGYEPEELMVNGERYTPDQLNIDQENGTASLTLEVTAEMQIEAKFKEKVADGIETIRSDLPEAVYFTIDGRRIGSTRPTATGIYIERRGNISRKIRIN